MTRDPTWLALAAVAVFLVAGTHTRVGGWNDASRLAMVEAIVEHGHLWVDGTHMSRFTGDVARIDGRFYSDKPPAIALMAVPVYAAQVALGSTFRRNLPETYYWTTLLTIGASTLIGLGALALFLRRFVPDPRWRAATVLGVGLGTLTTSYSTTFSNHAPAAMALLGGFLLIWHWRRWGGGLGSLGAGAALVGIAALADHGAAFYLPSFLAYALWPAGAAPEGTARRGRRRIAAASVFTLCAAVPLTAYALYALALSGSPLPLPLQPALFDYPGSYFAGATHLAGSSIPHRSARDLLAYAGLCLVGYRGLFSHTPALLFVLAGMVRTAARPHPRRAEMVAVLAPTAILVTYYLVTSTDAGGNAYGVRWFCLFIPLAYVFLYDAYRTLRTRVARGAFWVAYALSFPLALIGALDPWLDPTPYGPGFAWIVVLRAHGIL